MRDLHTQELWC